MSRSLFPTCLLLLLLPIIHSCLNGQSPDHQSKITKIESGLLPSIVINGHEEQFALTERMEHYKVPGVSIAFFDAGEIQWVRTYGYSDASANTPVLPETMFQAASISKPVAASGMLAMVEAGQLDLDADVNAYLTDWKIPETKFTEEKKVTLRGLVTHSAGMTIHGFPGYARGVDWPTTIDVLNGSQPANTGAIRPDTMPGTIWRYSGGGYTVMQKAVSDVSGLAFSEYMEREVLKKVGMTNSTYEQPLPEKWHAQASRAHNGLGAVIEGDWHSYPEMAAAGLWTTPTDLAKFAIAIQNAYDGKENHFLSRKSVRAMLTPHLNDWGLGPSLDVDKHQLSFSHGGANNGFRCHLYAFVKPYRQGYVIMTNGDNGGALGNEIGRAISNVYGWNVFEPDYRNTIELPAEELKEFVGTYRMDAQIAVEIFMEDTHLQLRELWTGNVDKIWPETPQKFFQAGNGMQIEFVLGADGKVTHLVGGGQFRLNKIK